MRIGAHVPADDPLGEADKREAECVQVFLSNPKSWKKPTPRADAAALAEAALPVYVHAPYLVNVASPNNKVRVPSRKILDQTCAAAAAIGAAGVIVHGGHVDAETPLETGFDNWRKALERCDTEVPLLIENTAGGDNAITRSVEAIERLWERLEGLDVGFCFDTCHAHAAGEDVVAAAERVKTALGGVDLLHLNDSRDERGSGRDRHANLGHGRMDPEALVAAVGVADAPVVCETPGDATAQREDIAWLRRALATADRGPERP